MGGSTVKPPGRIIHHSRSEEDRIKFSWLFLSTKMFFITVAINILNMKGAWSLESPAPIEVMTETRLTLLDFIAERIVRVESVSMVSPTSLVLPPRAITTPSMEFPSKIWE